MWVDSYEDDHKVSLQNHKFGWTISSKNHPIAVVDACALRSFTYRAAARGSVLLFMFLASNIFHHYANKTSKFVAL